MKNKSFFYRAFIALTLLAAIPTIIITVILSYQVIRYSEDEISKSAIGKLKVAANFNKTIAQNLYMDALKLNVNGMIDSMSGINSYDIIFSVPDGITNTSKLQNALSGMLRSNDVLHSVYLYPEGSDFILTSSGIFKIKDFSDTGWINDYKNFIKFKSDSAWLLTRNLATSGTDNGKQDAASYKVITFFYRLTPYTTTVQGTLIFNIREEALLNLINSNTSINEGHMIILNSAGDVISHINNELVGKKLNESYTDKILKSTGNEGYLISGTGHERQLITYYKSDFNDWIYVGIFPLSVLMDKVNNLMARTFYICFSFLIIGTFVSYLISRKMSSPLNKLVQDIKKRKGIDIKSNDGEVAILSNAFEFMLKEEDRLFSILESNRDTNRNLYIMNLLQGKVRKDLSPDITGIDFIHSRFLCIVLNIDKYKEFASLYSPEQRDYMRTLILKVSEQLLGTVFVCAGTVYEKQKIALIANFGDCPAPDLEACLKEIFIKIQEELIKVFDNTISIGIGSIQDSLMGISESFDRAQEALKYKLVNGFGSINFWRESQNEVTAYYYPYALEKQIFNMINSGCKDKLQAAISELIQDIRDKKDMPYENIVQIFNQFAVNTVKFLLDMHLNISMVFGSNYNIYHELSTKETIEDIKIWLVDMYSAISNYISQSRKESKSYFERALDFICENYKKDIDINIIADNVGLSYSHLRKIFKDETGDNIINYVNSMRINESKRLLLQTNLTIRDIALNVGYNNEQSFIRFFKKYESISPKEFRISHKLSTQVKNAAGADNHANWQNTAAKTF